MSEVKDAYERQIRIQAEIAADRSKAKTTHVSSESFDLDAVHEAARRKDRVLWQNDSVDIAAEILRRTGPALEVAGPTGYGFEVLDDLELPKQYATSNVHHGLPFYHEGRMEFVASVDLQADAGNIPVADGSLGMLLASCVPEADAPYGEGLRAALTEEASRVLEPGGLLVLQGAKWTDALYGQRWGLEPVKVLAEDQEYLSIVARKSDRGVEGGRDHRP